MSTPELSAAERTMLEGLDALMERVGDDGPIVAADFGSVGPRWWTPTHVYGAHMEKRLITSFPRNPPND